MMFCGYSVSVSGVGFGKCLHPRRGFILYSSPVLFGVAMFCSFRSTFCFMFCSFVPCRQTGEQVNMHATLVVAVAEAAAAAAAAAAAVAVAVAEAVAVEVEV